jgi:hypothetical protein
MLKMKDLGAAVFRKKRQRNGWRKLEEREDYLTTIIHQKVFLSRKNPTDKPAETDGPVSMHGAS